jgi:hypothetical protein
LAILISAAFWTELWGPIGLVVSTPLTVLLFVLGRHIPQFQFLYILLGDEPVLSPEARYYQRLLSMDDGEARDIAEEHLKEKTVIELYDSVLIPALSLAEHDKHHNALDENRQQFLYQSTRELIGELADDTTISSEEQDKRAEPFSVLCLPLNDEADELASLMLTQILRKAGHQVQTTAIGQFDEMLSNAKGPLPNTVVVSAIPPFAASRLRTLCRKMREKYPSVTIVIGFWAADSKALEDRLGPGTFDYLVHTLAEAELQLRVPQARLQRLDRRGPGNSRPAELNEPQPEPV